MNDPKPQLPDDPYQRWALMRQQLPVYQEETGGPYAVARYDDVLAILRDHGTYSSDVSLRSEEEKKIRPSMLFSDPPVSSW